MSYTKHYWTTGEKITPRALNNIEQGLSEGNVFIINRTTDTTTGNNILDKTFTEIKSAFFSGKKCIINTSDELYELVYFIQEKSDICVVNEFSCDSPNGYPQNLPK